MQLGVSTFYSVPQKEDTVELCNSNTSAIVSDTLWYQLIPRKARFFSASLITLYTLVYNDIATNRAQFIIVKMFGNEEVEGTIFK
jgi:hypothetical protein